MIKNTLFGRHFLLLAFALVAAIALAISPWAPKTNCYAAMAFPTALVQESGEESDADDSEPAEDQEPANDAAAETDGDAAAETDGDADETEEVAADSEESIVKQINKAIEPVDKWFGENLVSPLATVFFFDFGTGPTWDSGVAFTDQNSDGVYNEGEESIIANAEKTVVTTEDGREYTVSTNEKGEWTALRSKGWLGVSLPFVVIWLLVGAIYLTLRMAFINVRAFFHAIRLTMGAYDDPKDQGEVSHFQALSSALSATVGLGNIAGVAIAIGLGGPGATFWIVLIGLFGMSSKFTECTLGQMYRRVNPKTGKVSGGPMRYLKDGLTEMGLAPIGWILAIFFALLCIGASLGGGNAFQVGQSLDAIRGDKALQWLDTYPWIYGVTLAVLVGIVIIGGIKSIGKTASKIVPFMCAAYVAMALYVIFTNLEKVGPAFQSIFDNAFNMQAGLGAFLGVMVIGIQRAVFSNEAGVGSAAIAHSAAKTEEPVSEGIVALLEPFIDTVVICTMTAIVLIIAGGDWVPQSNADSILAKDYGAWTNPDYSENVNASAKNGAALTVAAVSGEFGLPWFKYVLYVAMFLFAYSTLISWYYYGERCWTALFGEWSSFLFKLLFLSFTVLGSIVTNGNILDFSDLLILSMALPNMLGLFLLSGKVKERLDDYIARKKSGEIRTFKNK